MKLLSNKFFYFLLFNLILNIFSFKIKENYYKELLFPNKTKERNQKNKENYFFYNNLNKNEKNDISFISSLFYSSIFNLNYNYLQIKENTNENDNENEKNKKRLLLPDINNPPDGVDSAICVICRNLEYCTALNGLLIQEVYYPESNAKLGTCHIIDQLGERMYNEIFGIGRTFRDTPQCRTIVMQYLCLFWGTENDMYTNLCYWKEDTSNPDPTLHEATGRPPCRSFCVQVAEVCANQEDFMDLCYDIVCPPTGDDCTPDPTVGGEVVTTDIACDVPSIANPYEAANKVEYSIALIFISCIILALTSILW